MWNLFKVNNKHARITSMTSFWCLYCWLWTDSTHCSAVSIVDFEQVNADWDGDVITTCKISVVGVFLQKRLTAFSCYLYFHKNIPSWMFWHDPKHAPGTCSEIIRAQSNISLFGEVIRQGIRSDHLTLCLLFVFLMDCDPEWSKVC